MREYLMRRQAQSQKGKRNIILLCGPGLIITLEILIILAFICFFFSIRLNRLTLCFTSVS